MYGADAERGITLAAVHRKDGGKCYLCGDATLPVRSKDTRRGPSIDHVVPLKHGGTHTWDNVRLAHRSCNSAKGARPLASLA
jgi:5-methylcytosine-specific restriction endonuclease McrA